jgi:hypothetical protein
MWIDPERSSNTSQKRNIDGVDLVVELSPYTKPEGVSGAYDPTKKTFVIAFDYFDNEPQGKSSSFNGVVITEGKYTGKLLTINIPLNSLPQDNDCVISLRTKALDALEQRAASLRIQGDRQLNQSIAKEVLEHDLEALVGTF